MMGTCEYEGCIRLHDIHVYTCKMRGTLHYMICTCKCKITVVLDYLTCTCKCKMRGVLDYEGCIELYDMYM